MRLLSAFMLASTLLVPTLAAAQDGALLDFGGDHFAANQMVSTAAPVSGDAFLAGSDVTLANPVGGDAHMAGFDVNATAPVSGDLYAFGFNVDVTAAVGGDVTAAGNNVGLRATEAVAGNVRAAGETVTLGMPVSGSVLAAARVLTLDAPVSGDLTFVGETLSFGPAARVDGKVFIRAPQDIAVPAGVAAADRVAYERLVAPDYVSEAGKTAETVVRRFWPAFWAAIVWWGLLFVVGIAAIALMPRGVAAMETVTANRTWRALGIGFLTMAAVLGLVPLTAITVIGLIALPFVLIFVGLACSFAYLIGAYLVGVRIGRAFTPLDSNAKRAGVLAVSLVAAALLGMIPVLGWLFTLLFTLFGFGGIGVVLMVRWSARDAARLAAPAAPAAPAAT